MPLFATLQDGQSDFGQVLHFCATIGNNDSSSAHERGKVFDLIFTVFSILHEQTFFGVQIYRHTFSLDQFIFDYIPSTIVPLRGETFSELRRSEVKTHFGGAKSFSSGIQPFNYVVQILTPIRVFHEYFARRRFNNFDIKFRQHSNGLNFMSLHPGREFFFLYSQWPKFLVFSHLLCIPCNLKAVPHISVSFPSQSNLYFHFISHHYSLRVQLAFFQRRHWSCLQPMKFILYFSSHKRLGNYQLSGYNSFVRVCVNATQCTVCETAVHIQNFLCNAAYFGTRHYISMVRLEFLLSLHK